MTFERLTDYDTGDASLPMGYNDFTISPGTRLVFDAKDPACYPAGSVPAGTTPAGSNLINLLNDQPELAVTVAAGALPAIGTTGLTFDALGQRIILPASVKNVGTVTQFGFGGWIKPAVQVVEAAQFVSPWSHIIGGAWEQTDWSTQVLKSDETTYNMKASSVTCPIAGVLPDVVSFIFAHVTVDHVAKTCMVAGYKDGVLSATRTSGLPGGIFPALGGDAMLGSSPLFAGAGWRGQIGRFVFQDFGVAGSKTIAQFLADEMVQGAGPRFF